MPMQAKITIYAQAPMGTYLGFYGNCSKPAVLELAH